MKLFAFALVLLVVSVACTSATAARDRTPPSTPTNLVQTGSTETSISIAWSASADNVAVKGYYRFRDGVKVANTDNTLTHNFVMASWACGQTHTLEVQAYDAAGNVSGKAIIQGTTTACAPPPVQCADGLDNDGDTLVDLADPGCVDAADDDETDPVPPPPTFPPATAVWYADNETGDASQWPQMTLNADDSTCSFHNVAPYANAIGSYVLKMTLDAPGGCRQNRNAESQTGNTYIYQASYYLPQPVGTVNGMWNVFQYKSKSCDTCSIDPMFTVGFEGNPTPTVVLNWKGGNWGLAGPFSNSGIVPNQQWESGVAVPVGRWNELKVLLDQDTGFAGHITVWFNGQQLFDFANVRTGFANGDMRWLVGNYSNGLTVFPYTLYIDNAAISTP